MTRLMKTAVQTACTSTIGLAALLLIGLASSALGQSQDDNSRQIVLDSFTNARPPKTATATAGGNVPAAVFNATFSNLLGVVMTPLWLAWMLARPPRRDPRPMRIGQLASLGHRSGVAQILGWRFSGFLAWWMWRTVYLLKMPGLGRKLRIALDWTLELFFKRDYVQLGVHRPPGRAAADSFELTTKP